MALGVVGLIYRLGLRYRTRVSSDGADATLAGETGEITSQRE